MRILNIIQKPQRRGAETFACDFSWWLRRQGHAARVVALYPHDGAPLPLAADDVVLTGSEAGSFERLLDPRLLYSIVSTIRGFEPDVVQCNGGRTLKYAAAAKILTPKALWIYRNIDSPAFWLKRRRSRTLMPLLVKAGFDGAVAVSATTLAEVRHFYGFVDTSIAIENGVDFRRMGEEKTARPGARAGGQGLRLIWVGALGPQKRPDVALELLRRLPSEVSLTLVGEGPWRARIENEIERTGLQARTTVTGSRDDVGDLMRAADLLVLTSDTEGIPAVVVEAQHCGLPVVAFDVGGLRECVPAGGPGRLVPHGDLAALAAAVRDEAARLASPDARAECMKFAERFSIEVVGPRYLKFYASLLAPGRRPA